MSDYNTHLSNPKWQKRRLHIFNRDNWACVECGSDDRTLHVHHIKYTGFPWDAPDSDLITLCDMCHMKKHKPDFPSLDTLILTRQQLIDKINSNPNAPHKNNTWRQAVSAIESLSVLYYHTNIANAE